MRTTFSTPQETIVSIAIASENKEDSKSIEKVEELTTCYQLNYILPLHK